MNDIAIAALEAAGYSVNCELSNGSFGAVFRATRLSDGLHVAAKAIRRDRLTDEEEAAVRVQVNALRALKHRHLVSLVHDFEHPQFLFHVFEYLHGGDLYDRLEARGKPFTETQTLQLAVQILRAVGYLHSRRAAHRDIKLENFVFETHANARTPVLKLIDFDLMLVHNRSTPPGATSTDLCGTVLYVPPELAAAREYVPEEADMWAVGVVLYVLLCFEMPFQGRAPREILRQVRNASPSFASPAWRRVSRHTRELVETLLSKSGAARPSAEEALARVEAIAAGPSTPRSVSISLKSMSQRLLSRSRRRLKRRRGACDDELNDHPFLSQERASRDDLDALVCYEHSRIDPSLTSTEQSMYSHTGTDRTTFHGKIPSDVYFTDTQKFSETRHSTARNAVQRLFGVRLHSDSHAARKGTTRGLFRVRRTTKSKVHTKCTDETPTKIGYC